VQHSIIHKIRYPIYLLLFTFYYTLLSSSFIVGCTRYSSDLLIAFVVYSFGHAFFCSKDVIATNIINSSSIYRIRTMRVIYSVFTLQIALEKIDSGSIQIDFERRLYCDYSLLNQLQSAK